MTARLVIHEARLIRNRFSPTAIASDAHHAPAWGDDYHSNYGGLTLD